MKKLLAVLVVLAGCGVPSEQGLTGQTTVAQRQDGLSSRPDLHLQASGPNVVTRGGSATLSFLVLNLGTARANSVTTLIQLPAGVTFSSGANCAPAGASQVQCSYGNINRGYSLSRSITVAVNSPAGAYTFNAQTSTTTQESNLTNNVASHVLNVNEPGPTVVPVSAPATLGLIACFNGETSFAQCSPVYWVEGDLLLNADQSITDLQFPDTAGSWAQGSAQTDLSLNLFQVSDPSVGVNYAGVGVGPGCFEGLITQQGTNAHVGAFRGCLK